jgi:hypothetical protein
MEASSEPTIDTQDESAPEIAIFDQDYWND